jgi:hypothetical protein
MRNLSPHFEYTSPHGRYIATIADMLAPIAAKRSSGNLQPTVATAGDEFADC